MAKLTVAVQNAAREPLPDLMDILLVRDGSVVGAKHDVDGATVVEFKINPGQPYALRVFPARHRPVSRFVFSAGGAGQDVTLFAPIHPDRVLAVEFPDYADLPIELKNVLKRATIEGIPEKGKQLYDLLEKEPKAGLLNLFTKMVHTPLPAIGSAWSFVGTLYRLRPDRIFFDALSGYRDALKAAVVAKSFKDADDSLHTPPENFERAGSFKSEDSHGNLQVSFFSGPGQPPAFKVDADIDESDGIGHAFEVIRNHITGGHTHPYDVHQILTHHFVAPPYTLRTRM
jgi:hypothetical protein